MNTTKPAWQSQTLWGIAGIASMEIVDQLGHNPFEGGSWQHIVWGVVQLILLGISAHGRIRAKTELR